MGSRGLRKHNPAIHVIAADPVGSILAVPASLNNSHEGYKVEGIGYDFIPDVLDQAIVNTWIKTTDRDSFLYARRLIKEEGLLCGGSSGSAMSALVHALIAHPELDQEGKVIVVILPDSVRNYLSKFVDDTWMENNDFIATGEIAEGREMKQWQGATIKDLKLRPVVTVPDSALAEAAIEIMSEKSFDQLPVLSSSGRLVGLVTLGNLLSHISRGWATAQTPVRELMFDFTKIKEIVADPNEIGALKPKHAAKGETAETRAKRRFDEITLDTPLSALSRFFEHNSAGVVTEKRTDGGLGVKHVVTKVDLLAYLVKVGKKETVVVAA